MTYTATIPYSIYPNKFSYPTCKYRLPCGMCELNKQYCMPIGYKLTCDVNEDEFKVDWSEYTTKLYCNA